ncbi:uncharacterized protein EAE98_003152 [Botrytis deweyae]|uniref:Rhamnogalacturonase B N-terminal domain-containing protein n=1 Tax=Botrytis deweyae TaxID=2478750 RepID=A0ABQ7IWL5_9HELO|nr:uncharacterized protein EAE98_003152 [Botrytis deweyae]KAF7935107.1 hypothetical protein EAE98_003152 [Botrytis deweyae]
MGPFFCRILLLMHSALPLHRLLLSKNLPVLFSPLTTLKAACISNTSCSYSFKYAISTRTVSGSTRYSTILSINGGKLPDIATNGAGCGGITDRYTRTSGSLHIYNSREIVYTSRAGSYVVSTSELGTSVGHYTDPTACALA